MIEIAGNFSFAMRTISFTLDCISKKRYSFDCAVKALMACTIYSFLSPNIICIHVPE